MDSLDAKILRELGIEPFVGWSERPRGLRASEVARRLDKNVRLVQDRITRMEHDGVIAGYGVFPNPRQLGVELTSVIVRAERQDEKKLAGLLAVDGFVSAVPYVGSGICLTLSHRSATERRRRLDLIERIVDAPEDTLVLYNLDAPQVERALTPLDWRLLAGLAPDARRPLAEVADEVGVTVKTARTRVNRMREEGSMDEFVKLDFQRMSGILPFELAVWGEPGADAKARLLALFRDRYLAHFTGPPDGYSTWMLRIFAHTPAEVQSLARQAMEVPGVRRAEPLMAAGSLYNGAWLKERLEAQIQAMPLP